MSHGGRKCHGNGVIWAELGWDLAARFLDALLRENLRMGFSVNVSD
jgi:hypothetical protein